MIMWQQTAAVAALTKGNKTMTKGNKTTELELLNAVALAADKINLGAFEAFTHETSQALCEALDALKLHRQQVEEKAQKAKQQDALAPVCYLAISLNYWGRGKTIDEAKAQLKRNGGDLKKCRFRKIEGDDKAYVDYCGCISYKQGAVCTNV